MTDDLARLLDELEAAHGKGSADGPWRLMPDGTRFSGASREILDDEGSVAVCSGDENPTNTTGADRAALIVAAVNALPTLIAELRRRDEALAAVRELAEEGEADARREGFPVPEDAQVLSPDRIRAVLAAHEQAEEAGA